MYFYSSNQPLISFVMSNESAIVEEAYTILLQLGGRRFLAFTGSNQLLAAARSTSNPNPWLRMNLVANKAGVNRLKISLLPSDTYLMEFYHQQMHGADAVISKEQRFTSVYHDQLQEIFTEVTGLYTHF